LHVSTGACPAPFGHRLRLRPTPIDGRYPYLPRRTDLASGQQLFCGARYQRNAGETILALQLLFALMARRSFLKTDNGSPFIAEDSLAFLRNSASCPCSPAARAAI